MPQSSFRPSTAVCFQQFPFSIPGSNVRPRYLEKHALIFSKSPSCCIFGGEQPSCPFFLQNQRLHFVKLTPFSPHDLRDGSVFTRWQPYKPEIISDLRFVLIRFE